MCLVKLLFLISNSNIQNSQYIEILYFRFKILKTKSKKITDCCDDEKNRRRLLFPPRFRQESSNTLLVTRNKSPRGSTFSSSRPPSAGYRVSPFLPRASWRHRHRRPPLGRITRNGGAVILDHPTKATAILYAQPVPRRQLDPSRSGIALVALSSAETKSHRSAYRAGLIANNPQTFMGGQSR